MSDSYRSLWFCAIGQWTNGRIFRSYSKCRNHETQRIMLKELTYRLALADFRKERGN